MEVPRQLTDTGETRPWPWHCSLLACYCTTVSVVLLLHKMFFLVTHLSAHVIMVILLLLHTKLTQFHAHFPMFPRELSLG